MAWPKGRPRPKKVGAPEVEAPTAADIVDAVNGTVSDALREEMERAPDEPPADWRKGALLNVRNYGDAYIVTLYPEEYRPEHEERAMRFTNPARCQDFVSNWYAREHCDPRAR